MTLLVACSNENDNNNKQPSKKDEKVQPTENKTVEETVPTRAQLTITSTSFRGISVGDNISQHTDYIQKETLQTGEGDFEVYRIKDFNNHPVGYLIPDPTDVTLVGDITIESPTANTAQGIKVGSTFEELSKAIPNIPVHGSEIEGRTYAIDNNLAYRLNAAHFSYEIDPSKIAPTTKITEISIRRVVK